MLILDVIIGLIFGIPLGILITILLKKKMTVICPSCGGNKIVDFYPEPINEKCDCCDGRGYIPDI